MSLLARRSLLRLLPLLLTLAPALAIGGEPRYDLVLLGGRVMDPASGMDRVANVAIEKGRIAQITGRAVRGKETLPAHGLVVAPGFIDLLAETDPYGDVFKAADGVTTVIYTHHGPADTATWYRQVAARGALLNYAAAVGHAAVREAAGARRRDEPATPEQAARMAMLADNAIRSGAVAIGFGIEYLPGTGGHEVMALAEVAARHRVPLCAHIRLPHLHDPFQGINELIAAAALTGARVQLLHIGSMAIQRQREVLALIDRARARGIDLMADVYPYDAFMTRLESAIFDPGWQQKYHLDYEDLVWAATGERLTAETFQRYRKQGGFVVVHQIPEAEIELALRHPAVYVASDGNIAERAANHPRGAGTFARVLGRYVREKRTLSLMEALRKMTVMPAQRLEPGVPALARKGRLARGMDADITVFDPETVTDRATYQDARQRSAGIRYVMVNGTLVVREGEPVAGVRPGLPLKSAAALAH